MSDVFLRLVPREFQLVGRIDAAGGRVFRAKRAERVDGDTEEVVGRVDFADGRVYEKAGDEEVFAGWTVARDGTIFRPDPHAPKYVAHVEMNGRINRYNYHGPDRNVGRIENMKHVAEGGAAYLLLLDTLTSEPSYTDDTDVGYRDHASVFARLPCPSVKSVYKQKEGE